MAKNKNDLFEVLGERSRSGAAHLVQRAKEVVGGSPSRKPGSRSPGGSRSKGKSAGARGSKRGPSARSGPDSDASQFSGVAVAAVAFACLLAGFGFGRWSSVEAAQPGGGEELNVTYGDSGGDFGGDFGGGSRLADRGTPPTSIGGGSQRTAPARLSDVEIVETLSPNAFLLLPFPALAAAGGSDAAFVEGKRLVHWLRGRSFPNVRLRLMRSTKSNQSVWVVLDYLLDQVDGSSEYARLAQLESPAFAPDLSDQIAKRMMRTGLKMRN